MTYAAADLYREVAYVALHFNWAFDHIVDLEHAERQRFVAEISGLTGAPLDRR